MNGDVFGLTVLDFGDGQGLALYAAGGFSTAGGAAASNVARWDGTTWSAVGAGVSNPSQFTSVLSMTAYEETGTPMLVVGGNLTMAGGLPANHLAAWDGDDWMEFGGGSDERVGFLGVADDFSGDGPQLFAGGSFTLIGGVPADYVAKWDGSAWSALGSGTTGSVFTVLSFDDGSGPALIVGGTFASAPDSGDSYLAKWGCPAAEPVWADLGFGLAGVNGVPSLVGTGTLISGSPGSLTLTSAKPSSLANLFVSFASSPTPFKGGTLVPVPPALTLGLFTNGAGSIPLAWSAWPAGVPSGASLYFQYAIADPAAPAGVALSNALLATTP